MEISGDKFKQYLKSKMPNTSINLRNKNANSAFDLRGIKFKSLENNVIETEKIELELNEEIVNSKKKKIIKTKK
jgi:hypothetical protein